MEIQDYPNYLIYPDGRVYSKKRKIFLKANPSGGYLTVSLSNSGDVETLLIHRLLALHYIPNPQHKSDVDHIDRNKRNNNLSNLRWATHSENMKNVEIRKDNKSGFKNISQRKSGSWEVSYSRYKIRKTFKTKIDALCYKYIIQLKIKAGLLN